MLSLHEIKEKLGDENISDEVAENFRDSAYTLAELALDAFIALHKRSEREGDFGSTTKEKRFRKQVRQTPVPPKAA